MIVRGDCPLSTIVVRIDFALTREPAKEPPGGYGVRAILPPRLFCGHGEHQQRTRQPYTRRSLAERAAMKVENTSQEAADKIPATLTRPGAGGFWLVMLLTGIGELMCTPAHAIHLSPA